MIAVSAFRLPLRHRPGSTVSPSSSRDPMLRRSALVFLLACAACAPDRNADGAEAALRAGAGPSPADARTGPAYLVWSADTAKSETVWIDGAGKVVARRPGVFVAGSGGVWEWREGKGKASGLDCECLRKAEFAEGAKCMTEADVRTVELADLLGGRRIPVLKAESDTEAAPPEQRAEPMAGVGPYFFTETRSDIYACGAHGFLGVSDEVRDLSKDGALVEIVDSVGGEVILARMRDAASAALQREYRQDLGEMAEDADTLSMETLYLSDVQPSWTAEGTLSVGFQFTTGACYACGDGEAGSYSSSVVLPADSVPAPLRPYLRAPDAVRAYWRSIRPDITEQALASRVEHTVRQGQDGRWHW
ncbi:MAG TPA: hypothetical protein VFQ39_06630, partial [Longimicrobium sp.]|nr:hypothetical protein [Longimicrobium sp.]